MRAFNVHCKEHKDAVRLGNLEKSAVAEHIYSHAEPHEVNWSKVEVLDRARNKEKGRSRKPLTSRNRNQAGTDIEVSETWSAKI